MNNLLSYFGLTDARMNASEKDLPVQVTDNITDNKQINLCYKGLFINHYLYTGLVEYTGMVGTKPIFAGN